MRVLCLAWASFSDRLDELAASVGGERMNVDLGYLPRYLAPFKYLYFFFATQAILFSRRPRVVYAQNPPVFCPLACLPYCAITGRKLIVDHHNVWSVKSFGRSSVAPAFRLLEAVAARAATANTVPHAVWKSELESMGASRVLLVHDFVPANGLPRSDSVRNALAGGGLIGIASGHQGLPSERVESEARAAERVEGVTLAITGPPSRLADRMARMGDLRNVRYLGYIPKKDYDLLKASCDFGLNISDEPFTVNHVLFEYAASSLPTISTKREVIVAVFGDSLVYVEGSDPGDVADRIREFRDDPALLAEYRSRTARKFAELTRARAEEVRALNELITSK